MSPDGKPHNQINHTLVDRQRHSNVILDVRSFRATDCDTDHYLVVAKVRERLAVNKQRSHKFHMERFNLKKLNKVEGKGQFRVEVRDLGIRSIQESRAVCGFFLLTYQKLHLYQRKSSEEC
jgi:16S rRNA C1402 N4-methylase RsmH